MRVARRRDSRLRLGPNQALRLCGRYGGRIGRLGSAPEAAAIIATRYQLPWAIGMDIAADEIGIEVRIATVGGGAILGKWAAVTESMPARSLAYQVAMGGPIGQAFVVNGVKSDGVTKAGVLLETKGLGYSKFVKNGRLVDWFKGADAMVEPALRQLAAAKRGED